MVSDGTMVAGQVRYQLTLLLRTPRTLMAGLILPGALLALQLGRVQHLGQGAAADVLAARVAGLVVLGAMSVAYLSHASSLVVAREDGVLRRWRATPLPAWGYFAGRITATVLLADAAALILVLVGVAMAGLHLTAGAIGGLLLAGTLGALALARGRDRGHPAAHLRAGREPAAHADLPATDHLLRRVRRPVRAAELAEHADELPAGPADDRRGDPGAPAVREPVRSRPGGASRLGAGRLGAVGALLPVGSKPATARADRRSGNPGPVTGDIAFPGRGGTRGCGWRSGTSWPRSRVPACRSRPPCSSR
jgi:hypothetical protein